MRTAEQKAKSRAYYEANRERCIEYGKAYYRKNRAKVLRRLRAKRATPKGRIVSRVYETKRKERLVEAKADPILESSLARFMVTVIRDQKKIFEKITGEPFHIDHIVPLCQGGTNAPWNLRAIPATENLARSRRI